MASRIDRLLERQAADLSSLEDREARRFLQVYEDARRELRERLDRVTIAPSEQRFTLQHMRVMLAQLEDGIRLLEQRLGRQLDETAAEMRERSASDLVDTIKGAEREFRDAGGAVEHEVLRRISDERGILLHRHSASRYAADLMTELQRQLALGVATGETYSQMRDRLTRADGSPLADMRGRAELIVRMEMSAAYNTAHTSAIQAAADVLDDPGDPDRLRRKASEHRDLRNHAFSRVIHDMTVDVREPFRVSVEAVRREHARLQAQRQAAGLKPRRLGGITWPIVGAHYVGMQQPCHFFDRGRVVPWRASWAST